MRIDIIARFTRIRQNGLLVRNGFPNKEHLTYIPRLV
jgi:hypothetical protein